jgi:hypothetical protein
LTLLLGTVLLVNLRLLGAIMRHQTVADVARSTQPLLWLGIGVTMGSGLLLFVTEATKCYYNIAFWYKMTFLFAAVIFQITTHQRLSASATTSGPALRVTAGVSLALWFGVGIAGRAIAFV